VLVTAMSGQPVQRMWGLSAAAGYALAAVAATRCRRGREAALIIALAGAIAAPLVWQAALGARMPKAGESSLTVVTRSAVLLLQHGTPYLSADQISHALQYDPYEPAMTIFGLPAAAGLHGAAGNPRLWLGITTAIALAAAFRLAHPGDGLRRTLLSLALAGTAANPRRPGVQLVAAIALGAACAIKATAWPALPIIAAMLAVRHGGQAASKFVATALGTAIALALATAPAAVTAPGALVQNTVLFPLGLTRYQTAAASPLPGHMLAALGPAGRWAAIGLLGAASLALAATLIIRPPADLKASAWRLAVSLALLFALAPASRWGYFVYPVALLTFVPMTNTERRPEGVDLAAGAMRPVLATGGWTS
jgi:hypothetical protein